MQDLVYHAEQKTRNRKLFHWLLLLCALLNIQIVNA